MDYKFFDDNDPIKKLLDEKDMEKYVGADLESIGRIFDDLQRERDHRKRLRDDADYRNVEEILLEDEYFRNEKEKRNREYEANIQIAKLMMDKLEKMDSQRDEDREQTP